MIVLAFVGVLFSSAISLHGETITYVYDELNRLIEVRYEAGTVDSTAPSSTASPTGGLYNVSQTVTLTCNDGQGSGCDRIHYTTDGTTPTASSPVYSTPLNITATTPLKFFARDFVGNSEAVQTQTYTIDTTPPTGTVVVNSGAATTDTYNVTLTLSCADNVACSQMQFSNDNITFSSPETFTTTKAWIFEDWDGTKTVYAKFKDTAGNWSTLYVDTIDLYNNPARPPIKIGDSNYTVLQTAYNAAANGVTIRCRAVRFRESLTVNRNITVTLEGGYDSAFTSNSGGQTQVKGMISSTAGGGTMTITNFVLEQ